MTAIEFMDSSSFFESYFYKKIQNKKIKFSSVRGGSVLKGLELIYKLNIIPQATYGIGKSIPCSMSLILDIYQKPYFFFFPPQKKLSFTLLDAEVIFEYLSDNEEKINLKLDNAQYIFLDFIDFKVFFLHKIDEKIAFYFEDK